MDMKLKTGAAEPTLAQVWRLATTGGTPLSSLRVAIVVGVILNLINQGDALFGAADVNWWKVALTFCVPYGVSTYGAVAARLRDERSAQFSHRAASRSEA